MGDMVFNKDSLDEVDTTINPDDTLTWERMRELSIQRGNTFFQPRIEELHNYKFHGKVYSGEVNWFFVVSMNSDVTTMNDETRRYHVCAFTPRCRVLKPHDKETPFSRDSQHLIFSNKDTAIQTAKDLARRDLNRRQYRWY